MTNIVKEVTANPMKRWMESASKAEQIKLARVAKTSRGYLYQLSSGNRRTSGEMARRLQSAADVLRKTNDELPRILKAELCPKIFGPDAE